MRDLESIGATWGRFELRYIHPILESISSWFWYLLGLAGVACLFNIADKLLSI